MTSFLIDTNVISEFARPEPEGRVIRWFRGIDPEFLFASVITLGEIRMGVEDLPAGKRRSDLALWLARGVPEWFRSNLLPVTESIADRWARLTIQAKRRGKRLDFADGLIAATALEHGLSLVTRNGKDFEGLAVDIVNPWEREPNDTAHEIL